jgi:hypothetical protein
MGRFAAELADQAAQHRQPDHRAQHAQGRDPVARAGRLAGGGCGLRGARLQVLEQDVDVRVRDDLTPQGAARFHRKGAKDVHPVHRTKAPRASSSPAITVTEDEQDEREGGVEPGREAGLEILRLHAWRRMAGAIEKELTKAWHFPAPIS